VFNLGFNKIAAIVLKDGKGRPIAVYRSLLNKDGHFLEYPKHKGSVLLGKYKPSHDFSKTKVPDAVMDRVNGEPIKHDFKHQDIHFPEDM
jgi:hypothetical protein